MFTCSFCNNFRLKKYNFLLEHFILIHPQLTISCPVCLQYLKNQRTLRNHIKKIHMLFNREHFFTRNKTSLNNETITANLMMIIIFHCKIIM